MVSTTHLRGVPRAGRLVRMCAALLVGGTLLAACGGGEQAAEGLDEVTFLNVLPLESLSFSPEMIADTKGFFTARGLDVTFQATQGSAPSIQTVLAGSALITRIGDIETMIAAGTRDAPLVAVGEVIHSGTIRMVSTEARPITRAADFRGKLVGTPSEGGTSSITLDLVAGSAGIKPDEVRRQVVGLSPGVFDLLTGGRVDSYIVSLDTAVLLQQTRPEALVYDPNTDIRAGSQVYATSKEQAQDPEKQDQLRRYLAAIQDATQFIAADQANGYAETMQLINSKYQVPALKNPKIATAALDAYVASYQAGDSPVGISPQRWAATYAEVSRIGQAPPGLDPNAWIDTSLAPAANP
ncbi:ABC transporter substrate-binding protein [Pseudonocardia sp. KRD291]|uniref:ABC transporter substrate-binding protein n=1 Tax=Pseudonocardia sp. KRD291 TaxID=2792007 RepID=UPI001C4A3C06|nr:ABC transporter substrate-binding protein [Pseudonocardia sp. KRD291]MBW0106617.1 ABC transporter substrate-binding protein [Pseudonocardia sp. KRD291]